MATPNPPSTPSLRLRVVNDAGVRPGGSYVLYWMTACRRVGYNYALDRAVELARELDKPLLVLEALRCDYGWASDRLHAFVLQGMRDNQRSLTERRIAYYPYVETERGAGKGLLHALGSDACAIVTDDAPFFFYPRMLAAAARQVDVRLEAVDSNGLLPLRAADLCFSRAYDLRRFLQRELAPHLSQGPREDAFESATLRPLASLSKTLESRWPRASSALLEAGTRALSALPIDHAVPPVEVAGGEVAARQALQRFIELRFDDYLGSRNQPDSIATSELSPFLHFGQLSPHEVLAQIAHHECWTPESIQPIRNGAREGWWGMTATAEAFLDQLVTWRELGLNFAGRREDIDRFDSLPDWARATLDDHANDPRPHSYDLDEFDAARTHDQIWNAAQTELAESGRMHNYLRMLWGKKILHWSPSPRAALEVMIELNNRYALDGRDPNSYSGIFWVLGRYDRAWGPEREVFGKIRYMSSKNTKRKLRLDGYLARWRRPDVGASLFDR